MAPQRKTSAVAGMKRSGSDLQQSTLSFSNKKPTTTLSKKPTLSPTTSLTLVPSSQPLPSQSDIKPYSLAEELEDYLPLGKGRESDMMVKNLELLSSASESGDGEELVTPKKSKTQRPIEIKDFSDDEDADPLFPQLPVNPGLTPRKAMRTAAPALEKAVGKGGKLNVKGKGYDGLWKDAQAEMGGMDPIHCTPKSHNKIHHILRIFDLTTSYGPCAGLTRLERWERASAWGLEPADEIKEILTTKEGAEDARYRESFVYGTGVYCNAS